MDIREFQEKFSKLRMQFREKERKNEDFEKVHNLIKEVKDSLLEEHHTIIRVGYLWNEVCEVRNSLRILISRLLDELFPIESDQNQCRFDMEINYGKKAINFIIDLGDEIITQNVLKLAKCLGCEEQFSLVPKYDYQGRFKIYFKCDILDSYYNDISYAEYWLKEQKTQALSSSAPEAVDSQDEYQEEHPKRGFRR